MANKNIPDPGYRDDDGSADPRLSAALAAWAEHGRGTGGTPGGPAGAAERQVLEALKDARLLVPVVAVLGEAETDERGLTREKTSDMAVPTLRAGDRRALPAFTSTEALARWDPAARPVAVPLHQALAAAAHERADTLVLDLAGPVPYQITGAALLALAEGRADTDPLTAPAVREAVREAVAAEPAVVSAHLVPGRSDGTLALLLDAADPAPAVRGIAGRLAADETLRARLVRGLDLAVLPAGSTPPGEPLYLRG